MKKIYVKPELEIVTQLFENHLCAGTPQRIAVKPGAYWGEKVEQNQYAKDAWINEMKNTADVGYSEGYVVPVVEDQWDLVSRGNESLWED